MHAGCGYDGIIEIGLPASYSRLLLTPAITDLSHTPTVKIINSCPSTTMAVQTSSDATNVLQPSPVNQQTETHMSKKGISATAGDCWRNHALT
jgi:hypothetical protein